MITRCTFHSKPWQLIFKSQYFVLSVQAVLEAFYTDDYGGPGEDQLDPLLVHTEVYVAEEYLQAPRVQDAALFKLFGRGKIEPKTVQGSNVLPSRTKPYLNEEKLSSMVEIINNQLEETAGKPLRGALISEASSMCRELSPDMAGSLTNAARHLPGLVTTIAKDLKEQLEEHRRKREMLEQRTEPCYCRRCDVGFEMDTAIWKSGWRQFGDILCPMCGMQGVLQLHDDKGSSWLSEHSRGRPSAGL